MGGQELTLRGKAGASSIAIAFETKLGGPAGLTCRTTVVLAGKSFEFEQSVIWTNLELLSFRDLGLLLERSHELLSDHLLVEYLIKDENLSLVVPKHVVCYRRHFVVLAGECQSYRYKGYIQILWGIRKAPATIDHHGSIEMFTIIVEPPEAIRFGQDLASRSSELSDGLFANLPNEA